MIRNLQVEILGFQIVGADGIDVFHHQFPGRRIGRIVGTLQQLDKQRFGRLDAVGGKFPHLIILSVVGEFVGYRQNLIAVERLTQRYIPEIAVQRVLARFQPSGAFQAFVILAHLHIVLRQGFQRSIGLAELAGVGKIGGDVPIQAVAGVGRNALARRLPMVVENRIRFTHISESHDVTGIVQHAGLVGNPDFHFLDGYARGDEGQLAHPAVVIAAEILRQEVMPVFIVFIRLDFEGTGLNATAQAHRFGLRLLLGNNAGQAQFSELEFRLHPKKRRTTRDERTVDGHAHVPRLQALDDFVLLAVVAEFDGFGVVLEGGLGVVIHIDINLVAHLAVDAHLNVLVKIEPRPVSGVCRQ